MIGAQTAKSGSRFYADPYAAEGDARLFPSATTVLSATTAKPYLIPWAAGLAAEYAVDNLDTLRAVLGTDAGRAGAVALVKGASERMRDAASERGNVVHGVAEVLVKGGSLPELGDDTAGYVDAFLTFVSDYDLADDAWLFSEATVCSRRYGYAGTCDGAARFHRLGGRVLGIDVKTGKSVPDDVEEQLAAYRYADEVWLPQGGRAAVPEWDGAAVLHLHADGTYDLVEVEADVVAFGRFLKALELFEARNAVGKRRHRALRVPGPDGVVPVHLEDVEGLGRCRKALNAAGYVTLADLSRRTAAELLELDGVGKGAVAAVTAALEAHGLALRVEEVAA